MDFLLKYWLEVIFSVVLTVISFGYKSVMLRLKEQEFIKLGMQAILRDRIIDSYKRYMDKGYYPIYAQENVRRLYEQYHNLGGNGTATHLVEELESLPTERRNDNERKA